jgi:uncharacterized protein YggE
MRKVRLLVPALAALALAAAGMTRTARAQEQRTGIHVQGQAVVTARPDVAILGIGANVRRPSAGEAFARSEELVAALTASLRANGVAERDIQTRQFSLGPEYGRPSSDGQPQIIGWRAIHTVSVKLRDFARIGKTIDDGVAALGTDAFLQGISFAIEDTDALAARARAEAIAYARAKAEEVATQAGVRVGRLLYIRETSSPPPSPIRDAESRTAAPVALPAAGQAGGFAVDISPGELSISVIVEAIYAIE